MTSEVMKRDDRAKESEESDSDEVSRCSTISEEDERAKYSVVLDIDRPEVSEKVKHKIIFSFNNHHSCKK